MLRTCINNVLHTLEGARRARMPPKAYVICAKWPVEDLTRIGQLSWYLTGGSDGHVGLFFPFWSTYKSDEPWWHDRALARQDVVQSTDHLCFDFLYNLKPRFHTLKNVEYWGENGYYTLHPIEVASAAEVLAVSKRVAALAPVNQWYYRWPALFGGVIPMHRTNFAPGCVGPSSCGGLTMRILAAAITGSDAPLCDDGAAFRALHVDRQSFHSPFSPYSLTGLTPRMAIEALMGARTEDGRPVLGDFVVGFEGAVEAERGAGLKFFG